LVASIPATMAWMPNCFAASINGGINNFATPLPRLLPAT
jgi:hypothetical protein